MKCIAIGGVPATGKTTLMRMVINKLKPKHDFAFGLLRGMMIDDISILGIYKDNEIFAGTDKLSMAVQGHFDKYIAKKHKNIIFEGDRLFTKNNLLNLIKSHETKIIVLQAEQKILHERHKQRNDNQNDKFLKSRQTKIDNICNEELLKPYIEYKTLRTLEDSEKLTELLLDFIN